MVHDWGSDMAAFVEWRKANPIEDADVGRARRGDALPPATHGGVHRFHNVATEVEYVRGTGMDPMFGSGWS